MSREERRLRAAVKIAKYRNELNKSWIGAKGSEDASKIMEARCSRLMKETPQEKALILTAWKQWSEKHADVSTVS